MDLIEGSQEKLRIVSRAEKDYCHWSNAGNFAIVYEFTLKNILRLTYTVVRNISFLRS